MQEVVAEWSDERKSYPGWCVTLARQKCGQHCPRNDNYKGRVKKFDFFHKRKQ